MTHQNGKAPPQQRIDLEFFLEWIRRDWYVIIVLLGALLGIMGADHQADAFVLKCNSHWLKQMEACRCACFQNDVPMFAGNFSMLPGMDSEAGDG